MMMRSAMTTRPRCPTATTQCLGYQALGATSTAGALRIAHRFVVIRRAGIRRDDRAVEVVRPCLHEPVVKVARRLRALAGMAERHQRFHLQAVAARDLEAARVVVARRALADVHE